ncbi:hypothetical protein C8N40_10629 [Pontibacter mucosus]|uniref:Uncharacterized protein n=1 Tax=Pontibacter mucosus TaxID=1649266 RepID=A0A2T5YFZ0_9BACT|nr:hypothetical protein [Pontibacter mucosus]PTX18230.1 hypothetical protein C8N40_10629 [Pontibacter mucosus]
MATNQVQDFSLLLAGTELETPTGIGRFRLYKEGNFRGQNVLVEFFNGKTKWYPEGALKLAEAGERRVRPVMCRARRQTNEVYYAL